MPRAPLVHPIFRSSPWFVVVAVVVGGLSSLSAQTVAGQPACSSAACMPSLAATPTTLATPTSLQQTRDAIATIALQIGQVTRDTSLAPDARVQQINDLTIQFNGLVNQLQQLGCGQVCPPAPATTPPATLAPALSGQQTRDMIVALGRQVGQVALDPSLSADARVQQIGALAVEVNQLESQLQRPDCGTACAESHPGAATPSPAARDAIAAVALKVGQVMQDGTLSPDAKAEQVNALATQFNQLVNQLQQQPQTP